ncbi:MAG: hypothetical protein ACD_3C00144G0002 [uncultured bacterium (gcode 4)]|uniref:DUF2132 domain-containing protein n=1 Tax=uncultured bacterium (gcode 4) TaxID=1234023 RepID=K2FXX3_9BACT|nr:MAG: hypothetical protein ACD_3C00144G0002 [uncultured bacterium (gcode 4)]
MDNRNDDVLHGVTLSMIMDFLIEEYGFEALSELIKINCFKSNPSKISSLKFLRKTQWARLQVQWLYVRTIMEKNHKL